MDYKPDTKIEFCVALDQCERRETMTAAEWIGWDGKGTWPTGDYLEALLQGSFNDWLGDNIDAGFGPAKEPKL